MRTGHLFAGAGGGMLADLILGHTPVFAVEWDPYACAILRSRAADGWFPGLRVYEGDVRMFNSSEYAGKVDCIHAGFPCQDISSAGKKKGTEGERSSLYRQVLRIANEIRPEYIFMENSADITFRGLDRVLIDIDAMGYDAKWCCLGSSDVGGLHFRKRWWLLAYPRKNRGNVFFRRPNQKQRDMEIDEPTKPFINRGLEEVHRQRKQWAACTGTGKNSCPPFLCRVDDELAFNVDRLACVGNGQDPLCAAMAWKILTNPQ